MQRLTKSQRGSMTRLAASMPQGLEDRRVLLARLKQGSKLTPAQVAAAEAGDTRAFANLLDDEFGDDAYLWLDDMGYSLSKIWEDKGMEPPYHFRGTVENILHKLMSGRADEASAAFPQREILKTLSDAFTTRVSPKDIKWIRYKATKRGGVPVSLILEDVDGQLGNMYATLSKSDMRGGMQISDVIQVLQDNGAQVLRRKRRTPSYSQYD